MKTSIAITAVLMACLVFWLWGRLDQDREGSQLTLLPESELLSAQEDPTLPRGTSTLDRPSSYPRALDGKSVDDSLPQRPPSTEDLYTNYRKAIDTLGQTANESAIDSILALVDTIPEGPDTVTAFAYAQDKIHFILADNPDLVNWARDRFINDLDSNSDNVQTTLFHALLPLPSIDAQGHSEKDTGFEYDMLAVYHSAGPKTRRNISGNIARFRNYEVIEMLLDDALSYGTSEHFADALAVMESAISTEEWYRAKRSSAEDPSPDLELKNSLDKFLSQVIELCSSSEATESMVAESLNFLARVRPDALLKFKPILAEQRFSSEFTAWSHQFIEERHTDKRERW